jgi:hypothetical protein
MYRVGAVGDLRALGVFVHGSWPFFRGIGTASHREVFFWTSSSRWLAKASCAHSTELETHPQVSPSIFESESGKLILNRTLAYGTRCAGCGLSLKIVHRDDKSAYGL